MKRKLFLCIIAMSTLLLGGCTQNTNPGTDNSTVPNTNNASGTMENTTDNTTNNSANNSLGNATDNSLNNSTGNSLNNSTDGTHNSADLQSQSGTEQNNGDTSTMISEERAREIALTHAGLTAEQVTFIKSGLDRDNGRVNYDVEFYTKDGKEYDYEIDPYSGEVLDYDYDAEYYPQDSATSDTKKISAEEAKQIALEQVSGATAQDIREFSSDYDSNRLHYEGKIYHGQKEYEFEIDGYSGAILEWDVETIYNSAS